MQNSGKSNHRTMGTYHRLLTNRRRNLLAQLKREEAKGGLRDSNRLFDLFRKIDILTLEIGELKIMGL